MRASRGLAEAAASSRWPARVSTPLSPEAARTAGPAASSARMEARREAGASFQSGTPGPARREIAAAAPPGTNDSTPRASSATQPLSTASFPSPSAPTSRL